MVSRTHENVIPSVLPKKREAGRIMQPKPRKKPRTRLSTSSDERKPVLVQGFLWSCYLLSAHKVQEH